MARIRLKTKLVLAITGIVFVLVSIFSYLYVSKVVRQRTIQAYEFADIFAKEILVAAGSATQVNTQQLGIDPADPQQVNAALKERLKHDPGVDALLKAIVGYSAFIYDITITDTDDISIVDTPNSDLVGTRIPRRSEFDPLLNASLLQQLRVFYGPMHVFDYYLPIRVENRPFGEIRVGISTLFFKAEIHPQLVRALTISSIAVLVSLLLAAGVSNLALRPLEAIGKRLDQMTSETPDSAPEPEIQRADEFGVVNKKIDRLGRQMRDVKEVFSALKENMVHIMGTLQDGLVLFTRDSRAVLVSASVERFLGRPRAEILGQKLEDIFTGNTRMGSIVLDAFALQRSLPPREIELENGHRIQIGLDFISERSERIGALLTMRDAESVRRLENEIELSRRMASIGRLTSGVAHEVKNPINAIVVHLELLRQKMGEPDADTRRHVDIISNEIHRLDRVVQMLVDFNRPVELRLANCDLRRLVEEVVLLAKPQAAQQEIHIVAECGADPLPVMADIDLLKQALLNVVLNGVQAMGSGGTLSLRARHTEAAAMVEVTDQGPGIPLNIRDKIFNLYFTTKKTGSGIGLAMSYRVLQLHHGSLDFDTELGRGSTFRLSLPLSKADKKQHAELATPA
jgi:signal transduction histidine kinase